MSNTVNYVVVDANTIEVNYYDTNYDVFIPNKILTTIILLILTNCVFGQSKPDTQKIHSENVRRFGLAHADCIVPYFGIAGIPYPNDAIHRHRAAHFSVFNVGGAAFRSTIELVAHTDENAETIVHLLGRPAGRRSHRFCNVPYVGRHRKS